jgi:hypothetical protein
MRRLKIDFVSDWRNIMANQLAALGYKVSNTDSTETVSLKYWNVVHRTIKPQPREFREAVGFTVPAQHRRAYEIIRQKVEHGDDLRPYQSRYFTDELFHDQLLNDWGVHHLHLGNIFEKPRLIYGTKDLLMARISDTTFFVITIGNHTSWTDDQIVEILHQNCPQSIATSKLSDSRTCEVVLTSEERGSLRKGGVSAPVQTQDGTTYGALGGGYSTSKLSLKVKIDSNYYLNRVDELARTVTSRVREIVEEAWRQGIYLSDPLRLQLCLDNEHFVIREVRTGHKVHWERCRST